MNIPRPLLLKQRCWSLSAGWEAPRCGRNLHEAPSPGGCLTPAQRRMFNPSTITLGKRTAAPSSSSPEPRSPGRTELVDAAQVPDERPPVPQQHQVLLCGKGEWGVEHSPRSSGTPARDSATRGRSPRGVARHGKRARGTAGQDPGERETGPQGRGGTGGARRARAAPGAAGARPHSLSMSWMRLAVPGM